jgi:cereblon
MAIFPLQNVILFPGETVPLRLPADQYAAIGSYARTSGSVGQSKHPFASNHFGVVHISRAMGLANIGTSTAIRTRSRLESYESDEITLTAKGQHRFEVRKCWRQNGNVFATVRILPENTHLLQYDGDGSYHKYRTQYPFPPSVLGKCSPKVLAREAWEMLAKSHAWEGGVPNENMKWGLVHDDDTDGPILAEADPKRFSYYLASHLPLNDRNRLELLRADNTNIRLRRAIEYMRKDTVNGLLACSVCGDKIGRKKDVFSLPGAEGVVGAYVNSHGVVHQTVTLREITPQTMIVLQGRPTEQDSWFPGFAWTIVCCGRCYNHLGWRFTITASAAARLSTSSNATASSVGSSDEGGHGGDGDSGMRTSGSAGSERGAPGGVTEFWGLRRAALEDYIASPTTARDAMGGIRIQDARQLDASLSDDDDDDDDVPNRSLDFDEMDSEDASVDISFSDHQQVMPSSIRQEGSATDDGEGTRIAGGSHYTSPSRQSHRRRRRSDSNLSNTTNVDSVADSVGSNFMMIIENEDSNDDSPLFEGPREDGSNVLHSTGLRFLQEQVLRYMYSGVVGLEEEDVFGDHDDDDNDNGNNVDGIDDDHDEDTDDDHDDNDHDDNDHDDDDGGDHGRRDNTGARVQRGDADDPNKDGQPY